MTTTVTTRRTGRPERTAFRSGLAGRWIFNLGAGVYGWFTAQDAWRSSCARLAARVPTQCGAWVADLGCGPGVSTFQLARALPAARIIGIDIAPRMLAEARHRRASSLEGRVTFLRADAARLPMRRASLEACTGHSFMYLVPDREAVLKEVLRVLKPGGRLVLMEPSAERASLSQVLRVSRDPRHLVSVSLWRPFSRLHGRFTGPGLISILERAGFQDCGTEETLGGLGVLGWGSAP